MSNVPTYRHVEYVQGYISLGLFDEAGAELDAVAPLDRFHPDVMAAQIELYTANRQWDLVVRVARLMSARHPSDVSGWISHAHALRCLDQVPAALAVLWDGERLHGNASAILHYNLACYCCIIGNPVEAMRRLSIACRMDAWWKKAALNEPDLKTIRDDVVAMR